MKRKPKEVSPVVNIVVDNYRKNQKWCFRGTIHYADKNRRVDHWDIDLNPCWYGVKLEMKYIDKYFNGV